MERRLAAVLIADVTGYSRLSHSDEEGTRTRFQSDLDNNFRPKIAKHHGRLVKTMGDGLLVEFHSVVDAVRCAVEVQRFQAERNSKLPAEVRLDFRIGINLGDVIVEGEDIHGEGVNIADRLQGLAEPGGIAISGTAYDQVHSKLAVGYADLGGKQVKNIPEQIRAYRIFLDPAAAGKTIKVTQKASPRWLWLTRTAGVLLFGFVVIVAAWLHPWAPKIEPASVQAMALPLPDRPSIVVLPLANMSNDPNQAYFADGVTEDLITELSKVSGLFVVARNTSFTYKGKAVKIADVAEELGVRYVLEGSVQRAGEQVRINVQLIDALSGGHVWADRFDGSLADVFGLQDKVTNSTADALAVTLTPTQQAAIVQKETTVPTAYEAFLRGWELYRRTTPRDYAKAITYLEEAIKLDPNYSRAYAALATVYTRSYAQRWTTDLGITENEALVRAKKYLREAQKQPTALARQAAGYVLLVRGFYREALAELKEAIGLDPGDSWNYALAAFALTSADRPTEAIPYINTAMRLDPRPPPLFHYYLGMTQIGLEQFETAAASLEEAARLNPDDQYPFLALGATYGHLGRKQDAIVAIVRYNTLEVAQGGVPVTLSDCACLLSEFKQLKEGLRLAGVPESLSRGAFAEKNRLFEREIRSLIFGHRMHSRSRHTGLERSASVTKDGVAAMSGDWVTGIFPLSGGIAGFTEGDLCLEFTARSYCGPVLRNPGGTRTMENEFIWHIGDSFGFSIVD